VFEQQGRADNLGHDGAAEHDVNNGTAADHDHHNHGAADHHNGAADDHNDRAVGIGLPIVS
jgi:hypothetical protein